MQRWRPHFSNRKSERALEEWVLLVVLAVSTLMIICAFLVRMIDTPTERAKKELQHLADEYYITYLYPRLLGDLNSDPEAVLNKYQERGVATTYLRQLLHFNQDEFRDLEPIFTAVGCDTNGTTVRYFPQPPYGPQNYAIKVNLVCDAIEPTK